MKKMIIYKFKLVFGLLFISFFLAGCGNGDIKDNYCGIHINFQYCKCAFHNEYCDSIGMSKGEAKDHVYAKYDEWKAGKNMKFEEAGNDEEQNDDDNVDEEEGECKYDSDCDPICEGDTMWKMGCNPRENECVKTFDTDCSVDVETFGDNSFPKICLEGSCARDEKTVNETRNRLIAEKKLWSNTFKEINSVRADISLAMLDSNKNCINGIADMTNLAIVEFATRVSSVLAGGIPDVAATTASLADDAIGLAGEHVKNLASAAVDYAGFAVEKLKAYQQGAPLEEEKKLAPHEYIKLNCDLYQYFKGVQAESDVDLQIVLDAANRVDESLKALP